MRLPLASELISRDGTTDKDATLKNGLVEANGDQLIVRKRPGMFDLGSVGAGASQVLAAWQGKLVGVAGDLITSSIVVSGQGISESFHTFTPGEIIMSIATSGDYAVAVDNGRNVYQSTNSGGSWSFSTNTLYLHTVNGTVAAGNGLFVICIPGISTNDVLYSTDNGANWTSATSGAGGVAKTLWFAGGVFFIVGLNGLLYTSTNGISWTNRSIVTTDDFYGVAYGAGKWVIGTNQNFVYTATSLASWTQHATPAPIAVIAYGNGLFVGTDGADFYKSSNGSTWTLGYAAGDSLNPSIAFFDGAFWATRSGSSAYEVIVSTDAVTWTDAYDVNFCTVVAPFDNGLLIGTLEVSGSSKIHRLQITSSESIDVQTSLSLSPATANLELWANLTGAAASTQYLFLKNSEQGFLLDSALTLSEITDVDYPASTVPGVVWLDGTFYIMDATARIYGSDLNNPSAWNALNFITAIKEPGAGVAIAKSQNYVIAFKEWSTEFFFNAGNPTGSPLSPVDNGFTLIGCASGQSVSEVDGTLFWISQTKQNGRGVHMMVGLESKEITTPSIQRILNRDSLSQVAAYGLRIGGAICYVLTLKNTGVTVVYNAQSGKWSEWTSLTANSAKSCTITRTGNVALVSCPGHGLSDGEPVLIAGANQGQYNGRKQAFVTSDAEFSYFVEGEPTTPATGTITAVTYTPSYFKLTKHVKALGRDLLLHESNGHIYTPKDLGGSDDAPIDFDIRTGKFDGDTTQRKTCGRVEVVGNKVDSDAMLRWSDDDYQSFSKYRRVDLSAEQSKLNRCGSFRRRAFELRHVADTTIQLSALEIDLGA